MVSFDWKYKDDIQHCSECGKQMSSFQIGTDELKSSDDPTKGMCSDCAIPDEREKYGSKIIEKNLKACGYPSAFDEYEESDSGDFQSDIESSGDEFIACPMCGTRNDKYDDCSNCGYPSPILKLDYQNPPDEHEYHDDYDFESDRSASGDFYSDPDDEYISF